MPLLVLTADRPPELRDVGAGQTIDQIKLYGSRGQVVRRGRRRAGDARARCAGCARSPAARSGPRSTAGPGPVHLNFALREPLVPDGPLPDDDGGRAGGRPWVTRFAAPPAPAERPLDGLDEQLRERRARSSSPGGERDPRARRRARRVRRARRRSRCWPSRPRAPAAAPPAIAHYDALLRDAGWAAAHAPELVLRVGDLPTSKPLRQWLAGLETRCRSRFDPEAAWQDPAGVGGDDRGADPRRDASTRWLPGCRASRARRAGSRTGSAPTGSPRAGDRGGARPGRAERAARGRRARRAAAAGRDAARRLLDADPRRRDVLPAPAPSRPRVLANRGANGIDGTVVDRVRRRRRRATARSSR